MNDTTRSTAAMFRARRTACLCLCLLGILPFTAPAADFSITNSLTTSSTTTNRHPLRPPPKPLDIYEREEIKRLAHENTERFRTRITLPADAAAIRAPASTSSQTPVSAMPDSASVENEDLRSRFLGSFLLLAAGILVAKKFAPDISSFLSRLAAGGVSSSTGILSGTQLAEEKMIREFMAVLQTGSTADAEALNGQGSESERLVVATKFTREVQRLVGEAGRCAEFSLQRSLLLEAVDQLRLLVSLAGVSDWQPLRQMASGLEMLLRQLSEKASNVTSSSIRTATISTTLLEDLCQPGLSKDLFSNPPLRLLVADDEIFSRHALTFALKRGLVEPEIAETGEAALKMATDGSYDLIFLDVMMPGMDGFELCSKIRETLLNCTTPVVFVTGLRDFDTRAQSILCGGRDIVAKPFLTFELTIKALTLIARERLRGRVRPADITVDILPAAAVAAAAAAPLPEVAVPSAAEPEIAPAGTKCELPSLSMAEFSVHAATQIDAFRELLESIRNTPEQTRQLEIITDLLLRIHTLALSAESAGHRTIAMLSASLEGVIQKLHLQANIAASALQTIDTAAVLIRDLCFEKAGFDLAFTPPIRTLVVDDDPVARRAISMALQMRGPKPASAPDGNTALALTAENPFDIIFLDIEMPDINGLEVCNRIRESALNRQTPVVFMSGHHDPGTQSKSLACGGNDYITKPFLGSELTLKGLSFALQGRLENLRRNTAAETRPPQTLTAKKALRQKPRQSVLDQKRRAAKKHAALKSASHPLPEESNKS